MKKTKSLLRNDRSILSYNLKRIQFEILNFLILMQLSLILKK